MALVVRCDRTVRLLQARCAGQGGSQVIAVESRLWTVRLLQARRTGQGGSQVVAVGCHLRNVLLVSALLWRTPLAAGSLLAKRATIRMLWRTYVAAGWLLDERTTV